MNKAHQQHQTQLELERILTTTRLQQLAHSEVAYADPVQQQVLWQMQDKLTRIEQAQARLATGQYGTCRLCREPIEAERLEIFPYTEHCATCQHTVERRTLQRNHLTH